MFSLLAVCLLGVFCIIGRSQEVVQCVQLLDQDVKALFTQWKAALESCDADRLTAMYWDKSILLGDYSPTLLTDSKSKINYFKTFLATNPVVSVVQDYIDITGCNEAQYNGIYQYSFTNTATGVITIQLARFSFIFLTYDLKYWAIKTHHSSLMPIEDAPPVRRMLRS